MVVLLEGTPDDVGGLKLGYHLMRGWCSMVHILLEKRYCLGLHELSDTFSHHLQVDILYPYARRWHLGQASHAASPRDLCKR